MLGISAANLVAFVLVAALVIVVPGPSVIFIVSRALTSGRRVAVLSVLGNTVGEYAQVILVAFGVGALVEESLVLFTALKIIGGGYLIYLGIRTYLTRRHVSAALEGVSEADLTDGRSFLQGVTVGATNPKTIIFLAAILPQFVRVQAGGVPLQILVLGVIFSAIAILSDSAWALAADVFRTWFARSPRRLELIGGGGGIAIAALGVGLLVAGRKS